jgi:hypothetical protein
MSLASRIAALAARIGLELKSKIDATHPGLASAWACFGVTGNQAVLHAALNVTSVTRTAKGRYRVHFATALPDSHYCWVANARSSTDNGTQRMAIIRASNDQKTAQYVDIACATAATSFADSTEINLVVFR